MSPGEQRILRAEALVKKLNLPLRPPDKAIDHALRHKTLYGTPLQFLLDNFRKAETKHEVQVAVRPLYLANFDAVPLLIVEVLDNPSPLHRKYAAEMLGCQNVHLQALPVLLKAHKEDPDADVRHEAGIALFHILRWFEGQERRLEYQQKRILEAEALVKKLALPLRPPEHALDYAVRCKAPDGTPLRVLLDRFRKAETDREVGDAVLPLLKADFDAVPLLIVEVLDNPRPLQRSSAASILAVMRGHLHALPALLKVHKEDPVVAVRYSAGIAASEIMIWFEGEERRVRDLLEETQDAYRRLQRMEEENKRKEGEKKE
jgi:hypothetical protein